MLINTSQVNQGRGHFVPNYGPKQIWRKLQDNFEKDVCLVEKAWGESNSCFGLIHTWSLYEIVRAYFGFNHQNGGCNVPNLKQDLRRLGLDHHTTSAAAADMSLSALYLHELHHR